MNRTFPPGFFYRLTWVLELLLVGALVLASNAARATVVVPMILLSIVLVTPHAGRTSSWRKTVSFVLAFVFVVIAADRLTGLTDIDSFIGMMIELVLGALPFMLLNPERPRSYWLATLTISVIAVGSITFTTDPAIYLGFIVFMVVLLFNLNAANLHLPDSSGQRLSDVLPTSYFRQFFYVMPIGLLSAAVIFVAFPRSRAFNLGLEIGGKSKTGYTGLVALEGGGEISESEQLVLLVGSTQTKYLRDISASYLLRGDALDTFDGTKWVSTVHDQKLRGERVDVRVATATTKPREVYIQMEPSEETTVFYPGSLLDLRNRSVVPTEVLFASNGSVTRTTRKQMRMEYSVRYGDVRNLASLPQKTLNELADAALLVEPESTPFQPLQEDLAANLLIPDIVNDADYFKAWREEVGIDPVLMSLNDAVNLLKTHFESKFKASLGNKFSKENALETFISKDRDGHCEYFATSTALMLRSYGIPTRVVVGYKGGVFNDFIDMLEVREANAHAWTEAFVAGSGWIPIDLTPPAPGSGPGIFSSWRMYATAASFWFRQYVVDYNFDSQRQIIQSISDIAATDPNVSIDWKREAKRLGRPLGMLAVLIVIGIWQIRRRLKALAASGLPDYYVKFQELAEGNGVVIKDGETLAKYHQRALQAGISAGLVDDVDRAIEQDLYAPEGTDVARRLDLKRAVEVELKARKRAA